MKKDFDFDDIGKRTPYRTPEGFFEDVQRKVMERAGLKQQADYFYGDYHSSRMGRISVCSVFATGR